jgi:uncharacterized protein (TIGR00297 family)
MGTMDLRWADPDDVMRGVAYTLVAAGLARFAGAVSLTGMVAGILVGSVIALGLGTGGLAVAGVFFVLGSVATRWKYAEKARRGLAEPGGGSRGAGRVLAKGGVGTALAAAALFPLFGYEGVRAAFCGAFAAAAADTLGTEVGQVRGRHAFTLLPLRAAAPGTEGAVSIEGTSAAFWGALLVAGVGVVAGVLPLIDLLAVSLGGLFGSLIESLCAPLLRALPNAHRGLAGNLVTTASGAGLAAIGSALLRSGSAP